MLKVFLVEDEIVMREGIKNNINWEQEGFQFVGEASDGELAYPLIQKTKPDILITDIRMPFMDGLELSRLVKQEMPEIKILVLSGYDEFEYAKEAINIGITDYLLKPIAGAKLLEAVKKVAKVIEEEQEQRRFMETYEKERQENAHIARQQFFGRLVSGKQPVSVLLKEGREIGMELAADQYNIILFQISNGEEVEGYSEEQNKITLVIEALVEQLPEVLMVERGLEGWAFILRGREEQPLEATQQQLMERLMHIMQEHEGVKFFGGVGNPVERLSELSKCYEQASRAFAYRYLKDDSQVIYSGQKLPKEDETLNLGTLDVKQMDKKRMERFLKTGLKSEVTHFVEEYFTSLGDENVQSTMFRQYVAIDVYITAAAMLEQMGYEAGVLAERCGDINGITTVFSNVDKTRRYLEKVLKTAIDLRESVSRKKYASLLKEAQQYIRQNFDQEEISLNTVAASVNLSPNHFSTIFSQELGQTFIEYLTFVRMERAKELLRSTSMRTAEIAFAVGYRDPHYFSYLFKKTQECTPREFRARN